MAEIPKWIQTLVIGIFIILGLIALLWFLNKFANPQTAQNVANSILKR